MLPCKSKRHEREGVKEVQGRHQREYWLRGKGCTGCSKREWEERERENTFKGRRDLENRSEAQKIGKKEVVTPFSFFFFSLNFLINLIHYF